MCVIYVYYMYLWYLFSFILNINNIIGIGNVFGFCIFIFYRLFSEFMCVYIGNNKY